MDLSKPIDPSSLFSAKDLVIVISGGGTGLGQAMAVALASTGAKTVYILGRRLEALQKAAESFRNVIPIQCDVSSPSSIQDAGAKVKEDIGYVDVLINNAGVSGPNHTSLHSADSIEEMSKIMLSDWDGWATTYAINSSAVVGVSAAFLPLLDAANTRRGWESGKAENRPRNRDVSKLAAGVEAEDLRTSQIITITSIAAFNRYITAGLSYSSSKAAATHIGKMLSTLLAPWGIRSNVIAPGIYPSEMTASIKETQFPTHKIPASRLGGFDDIAGQILFFVGRSGAYHNGSVQVTDGGRISVHPGTF